MGTVALVERLPDELSDVDNDFVAAAVAVRTDLAGDRA